jgi:hypothetical protein
MTKMTIDSIVVVADKVVSCDLDGEAAILDLKDGIYYGLDPVGAKIWNLIQKPIILKEIIKIILDEYDVNKDQCTNDIFELIEELLDNRLVKVDE